VIDKNQNPISLRQEFYRKLTHLGALVIPVGYYYLGLSRFEALAVMIPVTLLMTWIDIARLLDWKFWHFLKPLIAPVVRDHEMRGDFTGAFYILATACLVIAFYAKPVAIASLAFIIIGDTAAALIGRRFGKHRYRGKSLEGSLAFLAASLIVVILAPEIPYMIGVIGAVVATVTEGISGSLDDNLSVPLVSGLAMHLLLVSKMFV